MLLNNMPRQSGTGTPNQMFYGRVIRVPGIPDLGRANIDQTVLAENRMNMREKIRDKNNEGPNPDLGQFKVGDRVCLFDEMAKDWKTTGVVSDFRRLGSSLIQSYFIMGDNGHKYLRPRNFVAEI